MRHLLLIYAALMLSACVRDCDCETGQADEVQGFDLSGFPEMRSSSAYNRIVANAEAGDQDSIVRLMGYYTQGGYKYAYFRNLRYWSTKAYKIQGAKAFTAVINFSADNNLCDQSWQYFDRYFTKPEEFGFYSENGKLEYINEKCPRPLRR